MTRRPLSKGQKVAIGVAAAIATPIVIAGAISGAKDSPSTTADEQPQTAAAANSKPSTPPAAAQGTAAGLPAQPATAIDQDGDPGTPCAMTYKAVDASHTITRITVTAIGELITHLSGASHTDRNDQQVKPGQSAFTYAIPLGQVNDAGAILQDPDGTRHVCSIHPG